MNKMLVFDMDGTIADLYGVPGWLKMLRDEDETPYEKAKPLYDMDSLNAIIELLKCDGWRIVITSWLAKDSSKAYDKKVKKAKIEWLKRVGFPYDEIYLVKYGTKKEKYTKKYGGFQILIDDNEEVRKDWTLGDVIDAHENILAKLVDLI